MKEIMSDKLIEIIKDLVDWGECRLDHHGYCQTHGWMSEEECPHSRAMKVLRLQAEQTPDDVRVELAKWLYYYGWADVGYGVPTWAERTQVEQDWFKSKSDTIILVIRPLIEAAELRGISTGTTAYESTCEALIQAAKTERDEYWKDKITTYITSDVRKVDNED